MSEQPELPIMPADSLPAQPVTEIEWRIHPVTRRPWVSAGVTALILLFSFLVLVSTESSFLCFLSLVVLFASLAKFYFPTLYRLTNSEIMIKTSTQTLRKQWSMYRSYWPDKNGVLLSPFTESSRLENFRGIYLIFGDNRDQVVSFVKARIGATSGRQP